MHSKRPLSIGNLLVVVLVLSICWPACVHSLLIEPGSGEQYREESFFQQKTVNTDPKETLLASADARFRKGQFQEAAEYAYQLIAIDPASISAHGMFGAIMALTGMKEKAEKELKFLDEARDNGFYAELIRAVILAQQGKYGSAEKHLDAARQKDPFHPVMTYYQGSLSLAKKHPEEAQEYFLSVLSGKPEFAPALAGIGQAYRLQNKMDLAVDSLKKAVSCQPEILLYRQQLIDMLKSTGQTEAANLEGAAAIYYMPGMKERILEQGMQLLANASYEQALDLMEKLIAKFKHIPEAYYVKATVLANQGKAKAASESAKTFISQQWGSAQAHHYAGMLYLAIDDIEQAKLHFLTVMKINPSMGKSFVPLSVIEQFKGNSDRALEGLEVARTGGEPAVLLDYLAAHISLSKGNTSDYLNKIKMAAAMTPGVDPQALAYVPAEKERSSFTYNRNMMVLFFFNGWYDKSITFGENLLKTNEKDLFAWSYLAMAKTALGKKQEAIAAYNKLIALEPNLYRAHMKVAELYMQTEDGHRAKAALDKAIELKPDFAPAYLAKAELLTRQGEKPEAIALYQKVIAINPKNPEAHQGLAMISAEKQEIFSKKK